MAYTNNFDGPTVSDGSNAFAIGLTGVFRTASFGGDELKQAPGAAPGNAPGARR